MHKRWQRGGLSLGWLWIAFAGAGLAWSQPAAAPPAEPAPIRVDAAGRLTLDLRDVELATFVNLMAKLNGLVTVLGDDVKGKVTVYAPRTLSMDEAFLVLDAVLDVHGFTLIRTDKLLKAVKKTEAVQKPVEVGYGAEVEAIRPEDRVITQVVPMTNVESKQLLESLRPLVSGTGHMFASENTNTLVITDVASNVRRLVLLAGMLDKTRPPQEPSTVTVVYPVRYMKAKDVGDALEKVFATPRGTGKDGGGAAGPDAGVRLTPIEAANAVIVTASPALHPDIQRTLDSLDVRRLQVLIEARIVEASSTDASGFSTAITKYMTSKGKTDIAVTAGRELTDPVLTVNLTREDSEGLIHALASDDKITILSSPRLLTSDNQKAKITVGQEQPILKSVTDLGEEGGGTGKTVSDFIYKDVGIDLEVTPRINVDRDVALDVSVLITSILAEVEFPGGINAPLIGKREAKTNVIVKDGNTLVIGGLIGSHTRRDRTNVPLLSRIPLLGYLLGSNHWRDERTELLVFITPQVVATSEEGGQLTRAETAKTKHLEEVQSTGTQSHE